MTPLIIGVDFDGTIVEHQFPAIGAPVPGAIETLRECVARGARLVLWTMRSDGHAERNGAVLTEAVDYLRRNGVELWGINQNPETDWSTSPKAYCHVYVDDAALGCPLMPSTKTARPMVDWSKVAPVLFQMTEARR